MLRLFKVLPMVGMFFTLARPSSAQLINPGELVVTSKGNTTIGVLAVNPSTGDQHIVSSDGLFGTPLKLRIAPGGNIIVLDGGGPSGGGIGGVVGLGNIWHPDPDFPHPGVIISIDPTSGDQTAVTMGGFINDLNLGAIHVDSGGNIFVGLDCVGVIQVDSTTGAQTVVSERGSLVAPTGLASTPDGNLYVGDHDALGGSLFLVDVKSGTQTLIASGNLISGVVDIAVEASGTVLVANQDDSIVRVDPSKGRQALVTSGLVGLRGICVGGDGQIYVSSSPDPSVPSSILQIDPVSGSQTLLSTNGIFGSLGGLAQEPVP